MGGAGEAAVRDERTHAGAPRNPGIPRGRGGAGRRDACRRGCAVRALARPGRGVAGDCDRSIVKLGATVLSSEKIEPINAEFLSRPLTSPALEGSGASGLGRLDLGFGATENSAIVEASVPLADGSDDTARVGAHPDERSGRNRSWSARQFRPETSSPVHRFSAGSRCHSRATATLARSSGTAPQVGSIATSRSTKSRTSSTAR